MVQKWTTQVLQNIGYQHVTNLDKS